jgi:hypothetical protein
VTTIRAAVTARHSASARHCSPGHALSGCAPSIPPAHHQRHDRREPIRLGAAPGADRRRTTATTCAITFRRTARACAESAPAPRSKTPAWPARGSSGKSNRNCMVHLSGLRGSSRTPSAYGTRACAGPIAGYRASGYEDEPRARRAVNAVAYLRVRQSHRRFESRRLPPDMHCLARQRDSGKGLKLACAQSR